MDLLAKRYASPFVVLDEFIRLQQFRDFVIEILKTIADEKVYDARWQYYLHRVHGMTFAEYVRQCEEPQWKEETSKMTDEQISKVVNDSKNMLEGFVPE